MWRAHLHPINACRNQDRPILALNRIRNNRSVTLRGTDVFHVFRSSTSEPFKWELIGATTKRSFFAEGLESAQSYWFAVSAVGAAGESSKREPLLARAA